MDITVETPSPVVAGPPSAPEAHRPVRYACSTTWEHNMSDDSDWHLVCYEPETDTLVRVMDGTTRYAASLHGLSGALSMTAEMRPRALAALVRLYLDKVVHRERMAVFEPGPEDLTVGTRIRFLAAHKCAAKDEEHLDCARCGGSGHWVNPKNEADKRPCFNCNGDGLIVSRAKSSYAHHEVAAGTTGVVVARRNFGKFFRRGYQAPDRSNTTVYLFLDDGRRVQAPARKLRLDREMASDAALLAHAEALADGGSDEAFYKPFATATVSLF